MKGAIAKTLNLTSKFALYAILYKADDSKRETRDKMTERIEQNSIIHYFCIEHRNRTSQSSNRA